MAEQKVGCLEVTVYDPVVMEMLNTTQQLPQQRLHLTCMSSPSTVTHTSRFNGHCTGQPQSGGRFADPQTSLMLTTFIMVALWNRVDHYIFMLQFVLSFFFFPRLISAAVAPASLAPPADTELPLMQHFFF